MSGLRRTFRQVLRLNVMGLTDLTPLDVISADARELVLGLSPPALTRP